MISERGHSSVLAMQLWTGIVTLLFLISPADSCNNDFECPVSACCLFNNRQDFNSRACYLTFTPKSDCPRLRYCLIFPLAGCFQSNPAPPPPSMPCDSSPCLNGGFCRNIDTANFQCQCQFPWTGARCEIPVANNFNQPVFRNSPPVFANSPPIIINNQPVVVPSPPAIVLNPNATAPASDITQSVTVTGTGDGGPSSVGDISAPVGDSGSNIVFGTTNTDDDRNTITGDEDLENDSDDDILNYADNYNFNILYNYYNY